MNINEEKWIDEFTEAEKAMSENYEFEFTEVSDDMTGIRIKAVISTDFIGRLEQCPLRKWIMVK